MVVPLPTLPAEASDHPRPQLNHGRVHGDVERLPAGRPPCHHTCCTKQPQVPRHVLLGRRQSVGNRLNVPLAAAKLIENSNSGGIAEQQQPATHQAHQFRGQGMRDPELIRGEQRRPVADSSRGVRRARRDGLVGQSIEQFSRVTWCGHHRPADRLARSPLAHRERLTDLDRIHPELAAQLVDHRLTLPADPSGRPTARARAEAGELAIARSEAPDPPAGALDHPAGDQPPARRTRPGVAMRCHSGTT